MTRSYAYDKPPARPKGEWLRISHDMTWVVEEMADRGDLVVKMSPDAGYGEEDYDDKGKIKEGATPHAGVTYPELAIIEIAAENMPKGLSLNDVRPLEHGNRNQYPAVWGVVTHESAHAKHSKWVVPLRARQKAGDLSEEDSRAGGAAMLLEESRIERNQILRRPQDQLWLQASATDLALKELKEELSKPENVAQLGKVAGSRMAALVLARIDAGSIDVTEQTEKIEALTRGIFGDKDFGKLRDLWREAQATADDDADTMLDVGRRWFELTQDDGGQGGGDPQPGKGDGGQAGRELAKALQEMADYAKGEATGDNQANARRSRLAKAARDRGIENAAHKDALNQASKVFHASPDPSDRRRDDPVRGYRNPTAEENGRARRTRKALEAAYTPERAVTKRSSELPPGKLSARAALRGAAELAMGLPPTAEPFTHKDRRRVAVPPLKVAIAQDVSGSQDSAAAAAVSGAWSLAKATEQIPDAQVAMVVFGSSVWEVFGPRDKMPRVPVLSTPSSSHHLNDALAALEGELQLTRPGSARLLVILTDGVHEHEQIKLRDPALKRLVDAGVHVLWFVTSGYDDGSSSQYVPNVKGVHVYAEAKGNFSAIPGIINREAVNALKK